MIDAKEYREHGTAFWEQQCPKGWVEVNSFEPDRNTCSEDVYGMGAWRKVREVLNDHNIISMTLKTRRRAIGARGSGPGGSMRLGDDFMGGIYRTAVQHLDEPRARTVLAEDERIYWRNSFENRKHLPGKQTDEEAD